ncbi:hypothetical protein A2950_02090 [Candidatus Kaiserbacteria bacterium RIFCSPLOWO2_01_FULL_55_19]|uniref:Vitamin K epoxide reductase domain-containing protein n=1 Tax=Candidatus Kaiserbacteria bacterium RIFCSPLOWO2_01_FULL_55_19 TaxID=1798516 RepID=A0A1F6ESD1_9BACT|nr:MAG: hypothetical protein A2950_02090 [Candidatus Kaiserbacteria bacterium RIFCSPLOWO2_01_FULL_55_19]
MKRLGVVGILVLAFLGLADSLYLAQSAETGIPLLCDIQNLTGCNIVAASEYSRVFGIPLAEYGVFFYGVLFVLAALELVLFNRFLRRTLQTLAVIGIIFSLYFSILQIFVINAFCIYCLVSALIALLVIVCARYIEPLQTHEENTPSPPQPHLTMPPAA